MPDLRFFLVLLAFAALLDAADPVVRIRAEGPHGFRFAGLYAVADGKVPHPGLTIQVDARAPGQIDESNATAWRFGAGDPSESWAKGGDRLLVCSIPTGLLPGIVRSGASMASIQRVRIDPDLPPLLRQRGQAPGLSPNPGGVSAVEWWGVWPADVAAMSSRGPVSVVLAPGIGADGWEFLTVAGEVARARPERVDAVRRAVLDGWVWVAAHPAEAMELVERRADPGTPRSVLRSEAEAFLSGLPADPSGAISPTWINDHLKALADAGLAGRWQQDLPPEPPAAAGSSSLGLGVLVVGVVGALILALRWRQRYRRDQDHQTDRILRARSVQTRIMPGLPQLPGLAVSLHDEPAAGIGGDFYVCGLCGPDRWVVMLGDVSGKDVQAAFIATAAVKEIQHALARGERSLPELMATIDQGLRPHLHAGSLITLLAVSWEPAQGRITALRAGHLPAVLRRPDGSWNELGRSAPAIGVGRGWSEADVGQAELLPGDAIIMLTDGVTETMSAKVDFGLAGAVGSLAGMDLAAHADVATRVVDAARRFAGGRLDDDATAVILAVPR